MSSNAAGDKAPALEELSFYRGRLRVNTNAVVSTLEVSSGATECSYWNGRYRAGFFEQPSFLRMCRSYSHGRKEQWCQSLRNIRISSKIKVQD